MVQFEDYKITNSKYQNDEISKIYLYSLLNKYHYKVV